MTGNIIIFIIIITVHSTVTKYHGCRLLNLYREAERKDSFRPSLSQ